MKCLIILITFFITTLSFSQKEINSKTERNLKYQENKGQWDSNVIYKAALGHGAVFLENNTFTFVQMLAEDFVEHHHLKHENKNKAEEFNIHGHSWKMSFVGANTHPVINGKEEKLEKYNYFIGNDSTKWAGNVSAFHSVKYTDIYTGIDIDIYSNESSFKYDFIVSPNSNPSQIKLKYVGLDGIKIENNKLILKTSVGTFKELAPYSYQIIDGVKKEVKCKYVLKNNVISFNFPENYNTDFELIIDPVLVTATLSGSSSTNFGHSATYDNSGNIYTGAISFSTGYPVTVGAFQTLFSGGADIAISKFSPDGASLIYATYIGGSGSDYPNSLIVNSNDELFIYGSTLSNNYPTTMGAFDDTKNSITYKDIIITHLNASGSSLIGSTYVGGNSSDGNNTLTNNYGDSNRGEIILDNAGNCYIASFTESTNFPTTIGAYQNSFGGGTDAVVFSMTSDLTSLNWSTYIGSLGDEVAFGLRLSTSGIYVCGATDNQFISATGYQSTFQGGTTDAYVLKLDSSGSSVISSTYWGTTQDDEAFFIDLDINENVYIYGLSDGGISPVSAGVYSNPNSSAFIAKLDPSLLVVGFSSVVGTGSTSTPFAPIAFMVDDCGYIYISGHSADIGLATTSGAFQTTGGFYLAVYEPDFTALNFATYFGGDHVDGGTSRFDPNGTIYQAVCSESNFFPTSGAYSSTYPLFGWDIGVFKIDFQTGVLNAIADVAPSNIGCAPFNTSFINNSNGTNYEWDFGDGSPISSSFEPIHTYTTPGTYTVRLIAFDSTACVIEDTAYLSIIVHAVPILDFGNDTVLCSGTVVLDAMNTGANYTWQDGTTNQTLTVSTTGTYYVEVDNGGCTVTDTINVIIEAPIVDLGPDVTTCDSTVLLDAGNIGSTYLWHDGSTNQTINVTTPGVYWVEVLTGNCSASDTIEIFQGSITVSLPNDTLLCQNTLLNLDAQNFGADYIWSTGEISQEITATTNGSYWVTVNEGICSASDTINIEYYLPEALFSVSDTIGCPPVEVNLTDLSTTPIGSINAWYWTLGDGSNSTSQNVSHVYSSSGVYDVILQVTTTLGCQATDTNQINVTVHPAPIADFTFSPNYANPGDEIIFQDQSINADAWQWNFGDSVSSSSQNPSHTYSQGGNFNIELIVSNEFCYDTTVLTFNLEEELIFYVPNAFTPDGDAYNNVFTPVFTSGFDPYDYHLIIFNRWGEVLFESNNSAIGWDGTYKNIGLVQDGVYIWKIEFGEINNDSRHSYTGHVVLIR